MLRSWNCILWKLGSPKGDYCCIWGIRRQPRYYFFCHSSQVYRYSQPCTCLPKSFKKRLRSQGSLALKSYGPDRLLDSVGLSLPSRRTGGNPGREGWHLGRSVDEAEGKIRPFFRIDLVTLLLSQYATHSAVPFPKKTRLFSSNRAENS